MHRKAFILGLLLAGAVCGQNIVIPVFVHKDGDASSTGYSGPAVI